MKIKAATSRSSPKNGESPAKQADYLGATRSISRMIVGRMIWHELKQLLQTWRKQDRIRTAPGVGSLLNIEPGRQLLVRQAVYQVCQRATTEGATTLVVTYTLVETDRHTTAQLSVSLELVRPTHGTLTLIRDSSTMELFYEDVVLLA